MIKEIKNNKEENTEKQWEVAAQRAAQHQCTEQSGNKTQDSLPSKYGTQKGSTLYLDLNSLSCLTYQTQAPWDEPDIKDAIPALITQLKKANISNVSFSFEQLNAFISKGTNFNGNLCAGLWETFEPGKNNGLKQLTDLFHNQGINMTLAFGGAGTGMTQFSLPSGASGTQYADNFSGFMKNYNINSVDFDVEDTTPDTAKNLTTKGTQEQEFMEELSKKVTANGGTMSVTLGGGIAESWQTQDFITAYMNLLGSGYFTDVNFMLFDDVGSDRNLMDPEDRKSVV